MRERNTQRERERERDEASRMEIVRGRERMVENLLHVMLSEPACFMNHHEMLCLRKWIN